MSGIEVAGLVLGSVPLLISALEHYSNGVSTIERWWRYKRELATIKRLLMAEHDVFQGTIERLLDGLVPGEELENMLEGVDVNGWAEKNVEELDTKLSKRLGRSYTSFQLCVNDMNNVVAKLKADLELTSEGELQWDDEPSFMRQLKRIQFTLSKSQYMESLGTIEKNNNLLVTLLKQNIELEPLRKQRSLKNSIRAMMTNEAAALYQLLAKQWKCDCKGGHNVQLRVSATAQTFSKGTELKAQTQFTVIFLANDHTKWDEQTTIIEEEEEPPSLEQDTTIQLSQTSSHDAAVSTDSKKKRHRILGSLSRILPKSKSVTTTSNKQPHAILPAVNPTSDTSQLSASWRSDPGPPILDLCKTLTQSQKVAIDADLDTKPLGHYAYLSSMHNAKDRVKKLVVHPSPPYGSIPTRQLNSVLSPGAIYQATLGQRYAYALAVASAVVQLANTKWFPQTWNPNDILLPIPESDHSYYMSDLLEVMLSRNFPEDNAMQEAEKLPFAGLLRNQVIFRLGIVLLELAMGSRIEALKAPSDPLDADGNFNVMTEWSTATRLLTQVAMQAGNRYGDVVRRCIYCDFDQRSSDLASPNFREAVYSGVVLPLEDVCRDFWTK